MDVFYRGSPATYTFCAECYESDCTCPPPSRLYRLRWAIGDAGWWLRLKVVAALRWLADRLDDSNG